MSRRAADRWFPPADFYKPELCSRCGVCCGSTDGHPCEFLRKDPGGNYFCEIYECRFGLHKTLDGHHFVCVRIQVIIEKDGGYADCAYVREIIRIRKELGQEWDDLGNSMQP